MTPSPTILVVDPDEARAREVCLALGPSGCTVLTTGTDAEVPHLVPTLRPRVVILATTAAGGRWADVVREIRRDPAGHAACLVVMASGPVTTGDHAAAVAAGADDLVAWHDGDVERLASRVRGWVGLTGRLSAALRDTEWRFRELAENIEEVFYNYDVPSDRLLYANSAFEQIWGRSLEEIYARPASYLDAVHPDDLPAAERAFRQQLAGEETTVAFRIIRPDGGVRWVSEHARPVLGATGQVERIVGTMRDITRAVQQERLQTWEGRVLESISTGVALPLILEQIVRGAEQFTDHGVVAVRLVDDDGRHFRHGAAPGLPDDYNQAIDRMPIGPSAGACGAAVHGNEVVLTSDMLIDPLWRGLRSEVAASGFRACSALPVRSSTGQVIACLALYYREARTPPAADLRLAERTAHLTSIAIDRDRRERSLRTQAALLDKAQDAIIVRDLDHRVIYWNNGAERLYGWTRDEALGRTTRELLQQDSTAFASALGTTLARGEWMGEVEKVRKDGQRVEVETRWTLVRGDDDAPHAILAIDTDITERRRLEVRLLRAQRLESVGTLAGGIAHDLNNLLAPILLGVDLLSKTEARSESLAVLRTIKRSAQRGADLVRQVLSFSRGVEGVRVTVPIVRLVHEVSTIVSSTFPKNVTFETTLSPDLDQAMGDPTQLTQVLLNLCVNARDAMPDGGCLTIAATNLTIDADRVVMDRRIAAGRYVRIDVTDTGTGMPGQVLDRIFDPFFTTKEPGRGTGLGLPTVLGIVDGHGGFVDVHSEVGTGSTFVVCLPAAVEPAVDDIIRAGETGPSGSGELVLVVDDEDAILTLMQRTLEASGYRVLTAANGAVALDRFRSHQGDIALVLTDLMMPVMDGAALIAAVRHEAPTLPVVASTGLNAQDHVERVTQLGVRHFLPKPYQPDMLLSLLRAALTDGR